MTSSRIHSQPLRVGIGGPVGSGKTALVEALCKRLRDIYEIYVITNDIYTKLVHVFTVSHCESASADQLVPARPRLSRHFASGSAISMKFT